MEARDGLVALKQVKQAEQVKVQACGWRLVASVCEWALNPLWRANDAHYSMDNPGSQCASRFGDVTVQTEISEDTDNTDSHRFGAMKQNGALLSIAKIREIRVNLCPIAKSPERLVITLTMLDFTAVLARRAFCAEAISILRRGDCFAALPMTNVTLSSYP